MIRTVPQTLSQARQLRLPSQLGRQLVPWAIPILLIAVWQLASTVGWMSPQTLPAPSAVLKALRELITTHQLSAALIASGRRAAIGGVLGGVLGFGLGVLNGLSPRSELLSDSTIQMFRTVPHLALIPLVILWFGIGDIARIALVTLGVFFPIYLNTFHGIRTVDPGLVEMGQVYGLRRSEVIRHILLPGALPTILVGVRYALGILWLTLIVAETIAANSGIGYLTMNAREFMRLDVMLVGIGLYALLGKLADAATRWLERWLLAWHPAYQTVQRRPQ